jgi:hypothetical protein
MPPPGGMHLGCPSASKCSPTKDRGLRAYAASVETGDALTKLVGYPVADIEDEHAWFEVYVDAIERLPSEPELLGLWVDLVAADPDRVMAESAALRALEPDVPTTVVTEVALRSAGMQCRLQP